MNKLLQSSVDPKQLSLTVRGALVGLLPIVAVVVKATGQEITSEELTMVVDAVTNVVAAFTALVSSGMIIYGVARKLVVALKK